MISLKNIVLTTDFSQNANAALPFAVALAKRYNGAIHLFHAIEHEELHAIASGVVFGVRAWIDTHRRECEQKMTVMAKELEAAHGVKFAVVCAGGNAVKSVSDYAKEQADIIVIATHGRTGMPHFILGSIAERVTRLSGVPVLTVRPGEPLPSKEFQFKTILLPTDFSQNAAAAEPYAIELARQRGGKIILANVVDESIYRQSDADPTSMGIAAIDEWVKFTMAESEKNLAEIARRLSLESGLVVEPVRLVGPVNQELLSLAQTRHADLIVTSTHGYTGLSHLMLGSVAENIVQTSTIPVLSVKPRANS